MKTEMESDPWFNIKSIFILTDVVIPAITVTIAVLTILKVSDKIENKWNNKQKKRKRNKK